MNIKIAIFGHGLGFRRNQFHRIHNSKLLQGFKFHKNRTCRLIVQTRNALKINFIKINLKSIWKSCFQHNFFIRSNLDAKLFPSRSEYLKIPIWIYRFNKFGSGGIAGFLGHSLFRTFAYPIHLRYLQSTYISTVINPSPILFSLLLYVHFFISFSSSNECNLDLPQSKFQ